MTVLKLTEEGSVMPADMAYDLLSEEIYRLKSENQKLKVAIREVIDDIEECEDSDGWMAMLLSTEAFHNLDTVYSEVTHHDTFAHTQSKPKTPYTI